MMNLLKLVLLFVVVLNTYSCQAPTPIEAASVNNIEPFIDDIVKPIMSEYNVPGLSLAVSVNGKHIYYNYGILSKETNKPVTKHSIFELGSVSKTFTATLASLAEVNGTLNLSDPTSKYMPELKGSAFDSVKLYNLGTHTYGGMPLQLPDHIIDYSLLMDYYKNWKPLYSIGSQRVYSNPSIGLLGVIAGKAFKVPFTEAVTNQIFSKLDLKNTYYKVPQDKMEHYAQGYDKADTPVRVNPAVLADEAYGVKSSPEDMIKFADANMGLGKLDHSLENAIKATHIGYFKTAYYTQNLIWEQYRYPVTLEKLLLGNSNDYIYKAQPIEKIIPNQPPGIHFLFNKTGSTNGFSTYIMYVPSERIAIVMLANKNFPNESRIEATYKIFQYIQNKK